MALFDHPACLITQLNAHVQDQLTARLAPLGIQPRHFGMLSLLAGQDGLSQHQLCGPLNVHRNVMVGLVDEMEERGLIERRRHPADRRAHAVHLLPAGRKLHTKAEAVVDEFEAELLAALGGEAPAFTASLTKVCAEAGLQEEIHPELRATRQETAIQTASA